MIKNKIIKKKAFVFGNGSISGVNLKEFIRNQNNREFFRKSLKIADSDIIISYLGRINFDKGVIDLITSFKHLKCKYSNIKLFFFGSFEGEIFSIIQRKFGFKDIHFFSDKSFNKLDFYNITDIFCLPSHREGFGLVAIEASAMSIPIVCSDIYGLQDSVVDKITGIKFNVKSYSDLSLKLEILIKDESYRNWLGNNGRNFVERNFSSELIINEWIKFYKKI